MLCLTYSDYSIAELIQFIRTGLLGNSDLGTGPLAKLHRIHSNGGNRDGFIEILFAIEALNGRTDEDAIN